MSIIFCALPDSPLTINPISSSETPGAPNDFFLPHPLTLLPHHPVMPILYFKPCTFATRSANCFCNYPIHRPAPNPRQLKPPNPLNTYRSAPPQPFGGDLNASTP